MAKKLVFNATDADTLAASDFVGSHLYASGVQLTRTTVGAKEALDVYVANGITVDLDGVYSGGNTDPDNVGLIAHVRNASPGDTHQTFRSTGGAASSDAVVAANVFGLDVNAFGMVYNGTTWDRLMGTSGAAHVSDGGGSLTVDANNLDIRDLTHVSDSVKVGDGTDFLAVNADGSINITDNGGSITVDGTVAVTQSTSPWVVSDAALANTALDNGATSVADTATKVITSDLANRKYAFLYNNDANTAYLGKQTGLSVANGFPLEPGVYLDARMGAAIALYGICKTGKTADVRNLQLS